MGHRVPPLLVEADPAQRLGEPVEQTGEAPDLVGAEVDEHLGDRRQPGLAQLSGDVAPLVGELEQRGSPVGGIAAALDQAPLFQLRSCFGSSRPWHWWRSSA